MSLPAKISIPRDKLLQFVEYDPKTGQFKTKIASKRMPVGHVFSTRYENSYVYIYVDGQRYSAHRAAWVYMTGEQPVVIDHINGFKHDNRWKNLRNGTQSDNAKNRPAHRAAQQRTDHD